MATFRFAHHINDALVHLPPNVKITKTDTCAVTHILKLPNATMLSSFEQLLPFNLEPPE